MTGQQKQDNEFETRSTWILIVIIVIIVWSIFRRREKEKELENLKKRLEANVVLNEALERRTKTYFSIIRWGFILSYLVINALFLLFGETDIGNLLNWNSVIFIMISSLTFARFGDFNSYKKWWIFLEIRVEIYIYRKSPELKSMIENDTKYKVELEKEIESLRVEE